MAVRLLEYFVFQQDSVHCCLVTLLVYMLQTYEDEIVAMDCDQRFRFVAQG